MEPSEIENLKHRVEQLNIGNYSKKLVLEVIKKAERHHAKVQNTLELKHSFMMTLWMAFQKLQEDQDHTMTMNDKNTIRELMYEFAGRTLLIQYEAGWLDKTRIFPKSVSGFMKVEC